MSLFTKTANDTFAPHDIAGAPRQVDNHDAQVWGTEIERLILAFQAGGGIIFPDKATLDATLTYAANQQAWVMGDATVANNGVYRKTGASGTGSWVRLGDLPYSFIIASDVGAGTPNAIQATTSIPVSGSALVWCNVFETNTGSPVTISFNGGVVFTIKTNSGNDPAPGGLPAGMIVMGIVWGATFRLISDQASSAIVAAAEAAKDIAVGAADRAEAAAASVNLPLPVAETYLRQKTDLSGYETRTPTQVVSDLALPLKVAFFGHIRENAFPSIMQWVTDPGAADWAGYFNAAFAAIAAVSQYKGTTILVPGERRIQVSQCNPVLSCGVYLDSSGRVNWPDRVIDGEDAAMIYGLGGTQDVFTWGNGGNGNVRGGGLRNMSVHMDNKTGGSAVFFNGVWYSELRNIFMMGCNSGVTVAGGYDHTFEHLQVEGYRNYGIDVYGTDTLRGDRLFMKNVTVAGRGTESSMTSTGDSIKIRGNWHTAELYATRAIKNGRYGLVLESSYSDPLLRPHFISLENFQSDYGNNSHIFATHVEDFKLNNGYFNSNLAGPAMNFDTNSSEINLSMMKCFGSYARAINFKGKTMMVSQSTFRAWNKANANEPAIAMDGGDDLSVTKCKFGPLGRYTTDPDSAGQRAVYTVGTGSVLVQGNKTKGLNASPYLIDGTSVAQSVVNNLAG